MILDELNVVDEGTEIRPARKVPGVNHQAVEPIVRLDERVDFLPSPLEI